MRTVSVGDSLDKSLLVRPFHGLIGCGYFVGAATRLNPSASPNLSP